MHKVLVIDSPARDAERFGRILAKDGWEATVCGSGAEAESLISEAKTAFAAALILWEIPGPPFGFDLLMRCRKVWPEMPVVIVSGRLDASLAVRAAHLGARDFLEKPLDSERVLACLRRLLAERDPLSPLVEQVRKTILGESPKLLEMIEQVAKAIPHEDRRVLLIGESGTGKEMIAQAIHQQGPRAKAPLVAVNISAIPGTLIESALFGHEKGAFTGAVNHHVGYLEEAGGGTLFLDEIGDLELPLQVKLLRVIQENEFRRLGGTKTLSFSARIVCATNRDLAVVVNEGSFRRDLYHRIAEFTVQVPPLRERIGDLKLLLDHFLAKYRGARNVRFARETLTILRSYPFPGNIRELENLVKSGLIECDGEVILPHHLPLQSMGAFLAPQNQTASQTPAASAANDEANEQPPSRNQAAQKLIEELSRLLPANWLELGYRESLQPYERAFDRIYLQHRLERARYNVSQAAKDAGVDAKTFRKRWKDCGLPSLSAGEEEADG